MPFFNIFIGMLYINKSNNENVVSQKLPVDLDNRLHNMISLIGGLSPQEVNNFANKATFDNITELEKKVKNFPSTLNEIVKYVGAIDCLKESEEYKEIINFIKTSSKEKVNEDVEVDSDGFYSTDTNPYFTRYVTPELKKILFKMWDKKGRPSYTDLKLLGVDSEELFKDSDFANVPDIIMPVLMIEWIGGIQNTAFAKAAATGYKQFILPETDTIDKGVRFKVEPTGYDYSFDESDNFGDMGHSCWNLKISIKKDSFIPEWLIDDSGIKQVYKRRGIARDNDEKVWLTYKGGIRGLYPKDLFGPEFLNKQLGWKEYTHPQMSLIEQFWEDSTELACEYFCSFCKVEVVLV